MSQNAPGDPEPSPSAAIVLVGPDSPAALAVLEDLPRDRDPRLVYLASLTTQKSRRSMATALERVARLLNTTAEALPWHLLRRQHTQALRARLVEAFAPATANQALAALRGVLREACRLELLSADELERATDLKPAKGSRLPAGRALSPEEIGKLLSVCDPKTPAGARDAALVALLYTCGLRRAELVALDLEDLDRTGGSLRVKGKGNKERAAWVTAAQEPLERWLDARGREPGPLFLPVDKAGKVGRRRLTDQAVFYLLRRTGERAGVELFSPHDMRRTFVTQLFEEGADVGAIQRLAGHAQVATTLRYDRRGDDAARRAAARIKLPGSGRRKG